MICLKVHETGSEVVLAACDKDLLGKKLEHNELEIEIRRSFYFSEELNSEDFIEKIKERNYTTANLFGKETVDLVLKTKIATSASVVNIAGIPHLQIFEV